MILHVTEIGTFDRCERKATLTSKNGQHLTPLFTGLALQTGTIVHRAHHLWLNDANNEHDLEHYTMSAACEAQDQLVSNYRAGVGTDPSDDEMAKLLDSVEFCRSMAVNYQTMYKGRKIPDGYKLIAPEQKVQVPIPGTKHFLAGSLDAFLQDLSGGTVGVLERKTYSQRPKIEHLRRTPQFVRYSWQVEQLGVNRSNKPPFVLYDGLWRRHQTPKGRAFEDLFMRAVLQPTRAQLDEQTATLPRTANEMAFLYAHPHLARTHIPWRGCDDCDFMSKDDKEPGLCNAITAKRQDLIDYYVNQRFTKRTDDSDTSTSEEA